MWIVMAKCLWMIAGASTSLVCGRNRSERRMTVYQRGKLFQRMDTATGNERQPTVARRNNGTRNRCNEDERRRWRPGRSSTWTGECFWLLACGLNVLLRGGHNVQTTVNLLQTKTGTETFLPVILWYFQVYWFCLSDPYHIELKRKRKADGLKEFCKDLNMPPLPAASMYGKLLFCSYLLVFQERSPDP